MKIPEHFQKQEFHPIAASTRLRPNQAFHDHGHSFACVPEGRQALKATAHQKGTSCSSSRLLKNGAE
jgi:hypothetical protein